MKNQFKTQATVTGLKIKTSMVLLAAALIAMITPSAATAGQPSKAPTATLLVSGLEGTQGSTVGPDGALYVSESLAGRIWRVDPETGQVTTFASGLPLSLFGIGNGGVVDVAFIGKTAYALVTGVASDSGGTNVVGIYRVDGPASFTVVADIGEFNLLNPPTIPFKIDLPTGFQYAIQTFRGGFLVTDAHLNRVLRVTLDGEITVLIAFDNIVPTGLAVSGVPFLVEVEFGGGGRLYALSIGTFDPITDFAVPDTGALVKVNGDGTLT